ncbi:MAG: anaerobic glycerol-3-phosphate dehydrogenase subunit C [Gracilibacteraceae bacterium]|jgi:glycerol-3-phosphate dehydrogenase subunit C|nr:anaerobic glycerol-3-phosphate dehydrogenase subunit C [Gracilibacteraceae bacterium]
MLTKQQTDALNNCLKCSICVDSCPVAKVNPLFPGPKKLGADWLRIAQEDGSRPSPLIDYCSNCKTCETVCPSGVLVATLNQLAKNEIPAQGPVFRRRLLADPSFLGKMMHIWPGAGNAAVRLPAARKLMEKTLGVAAQAPMPAYSRQSLRRRLAGRRSPVSGGERREVVYMPGCFVQYNKPEIGLALIGILERLGYRVITPDFHCCGQASISNARLRNTRRFAGHNLRLLRETLTGGRALIFTCPSCLLTFKEEYKNILNMREFEQFIPQMQEAGQFLLEQREELQALLPARAETYPPMAYHEPCHLKASGQGTPGLFLLKHLLNLPITPIEAGCCGLAGSYGLKAEKYRIAEDVGQNVRDAVFSLEAKAAVTECGMCSVQIHGLTRLPVYHPLEILGRLLNGGKD